MIHRSIAAALVVALPALAAAQSPQALQVASLAATCANCHGTQGKPPDGSTVPRLAGMPKSQMVAQMEAFRAGQRPATIMHQLSKGYTDAQIGQLADYFAAQK